MARIIDGLQYIASCPDLIEAFGANAAAGRQHYLQFGRYEGRQIDTFDEKQYLANYSDLVAAFGSNGNAATVHYVRNGYIEGRTDEKPLPAGFDGLQYVASHDDLIQAFGANPNAGEQHYLHFGRAEGRKIDTFDETQYLANYSDLAAAFQNNGGAATLHYILFGRSEERTDDPLSQSIHGGPGDDSLFGGPGNDELYGEDGNDTIDGRGGDDYIDGGDSYSERIEFRESLFGGTGNDTIYGGSGNEVIDRGDGNDYINTGTSDGGSDYFDLAQGGNGDDVLIDPSRGVSLLGERASLSGDAGNDFLTGISLSGGSGNDLLTSIDPLKTTRAGLDGGPGADDFVINSASNASRAGHIFDDHFNVSISDFKPVEGDELILSLWNETGTIKTMNDTEIKQMLDRNDDHRIDRSDGYDPVTGMGVIEAFDSSDLVLSLGHGDSVHLSKVTHLDFFV